ncbi:MAG: Na/Pi cotransporter family protein [Rhodospirillales bacterium]|nr:Na/Pi cotransporter family protein [Rhodospirillales bacterium]MBO6786056.1 Na/Pi cotransporter family protein [Rhodospirillales bacterium]
MISWTLAGSALGGIGLFLLGIHLMTAGLKVAAGDTLRDVLGHWTNSRARGLLSGILITGLVQSSSAVTVAAIGIVNAGLLTLPQAMWVVFGSNVGTTLTGWLVALIGINFKIEALALPLLGIGMILFLSGTSTRRGALGEALTGFGIFFLGIATLKLTFEGIAAEIDVTHLQIEGVWNTAAFVGAGIVLTTLMQSSSAVIAIAITAALGGLLSIESGAALVIGANIGTTSTALIAVFGATAAAKRVALSHVFFNILTGLSALAMLPVMLLIVTFIETKVAGVRAPATTLALFHTAFNVLGILLMWPLSKRLETWLATRLSTREEAEARPQYLDEFSLAVPSIALNAIVLEMKRIADVAYGIAKSSLVDREVSVPRLEHKLEIADALSEAVYGYIRRLNAGRNTEDIAMSLSSIVRAIWHYLEIARNGRDLATRRHRLDHLPADYVHRFHAVAAKLASEISASGVKTGVPEDGQSPNGSGFETAYQELKAETLRAAGSGELTVAQTGIALDALNDMRSIANHLEKAAKRLESVDVS